MHLLRPIAWVLLLFSIVVYLSAKYKLVGLDAFEDTGTSISLAESLHLSIEQPSKYLIIYNDDSAGIYSPHINYTWLDKPPTIDGFGPSWYGVYYYEIAVPGYRALVVFGLSLWYFILFSAMAVLTIEYKARSHSSPTRRSCVVP